MKRIRAPRTIKAAILLLIGLMIEQITTRQVGLPSMPEGCVVRAVSDGDTFTVGCKNYRGKIRLIGVDAPEYHANKKAKRDSERSGQSVAVINQLGAASRQHLLEMMPLGTAIELVEDIDRQDRYGRFLAYVYLPNGQMVNQQQVLDGYAMPMTVPPNVKHAELFRLAHAEVRAKQLGLWQSD